MNNTITIEQIKQDLRTAAYTERLLPPVRPAGYRSCMPDIVYTPEEIAFMERHPLRLSPTLEQVTLWDKVILDWYKPLIDDEWPLVWKRANNLPWKVLCRTYGKSRQALTCTYNVAIGKIFGYLIKPEKMS